MDEDLRALSIMPGKKRGDMTVKGKASLWVTIYWLCGLSMLTSSVCYISCVAWIRMITSTRMMRLTWQICHLLYVFLTDLAVSSRRRCWLPLPSLQMLHDSGSERSPSTPPEIIRTPHSVSFRVTDEPFIYIKDALHPSMLPQHDNCSSSSFFAASASLYASQHDSSKITAQTFFDTPTDHSSGIGARKRSPHLYIRRGDEHKRRRVTPDVSKRAFMPPRTMRRPFVHNTA